MAIMKIYASTAVSLCLIGEVCAADLPRTTQPLAPVAPVTERSAFAGLSVSGGLGMSVLTNRVSRSYDYTNQYAGSPDAAESGTIAATNHAFATTPHISLEYTMALPSDMLLGVRASYQFNPPTASVDSETNNFANPNSRSDPLNGYGVITRISGKNHFSAGMEMGYQLSKTMAVFTGLNYHNMIMNYRSSSRYTAGTLLTPVVSEANNGRHVDGVGVTVGVKHNFGSNWFIESNLEYTWYKPASITGPNFSSVGDEISLTQASKLTLSTFDSRIGVGYRF